MRRSLIFHCFPKAGTDWRRVCLATFRFRAVFDGRIIISIVYGAGCDPAGEVVRWFEQFGPGLEFKLAPNNPGQGINTTFRDQIRTICDEPGIVFKSHTKGVSHTDGSCVLWLDSMTRGCLGDMDLVEQKFREKYRTFGVFKTTTREGAAVMGQLKGAWMSPWPGWHYPGACFWFDPLFIPPTWFGLPTHYYENEAFPCWLGPSETAFSLTPPNADFRKPLCSPLKTPAAAVTDSIWWRSSLSATSRSPMRS